jgi:hypothetical protein
MELLPRHIAVTAPRDSAIAPVKTGANRGHGVPVTPDERAPLIRGRFFATLLPSRVASLFHKPFS